jgi:chromosome segregation ATPase
MRVCTQPDDQTATEIERITSERGISKSQFLLEALNHFMSCKGQKPDASTVEALKAGYDQAVSLAGEIDGLKAEIDRLKTSLEEASSKAAKAEEQLALTRSDADKVYGEIASLSKGLQEAQSKAEKEVVEKNQAQHEAAKANEGVQGLRADLEHSRGVIKLKDDEIGFLRATIHQLSDKIPRALPMSEEEARARQWWKFW